MVKTTDQPNWEVYHHVLGLIETCDWGTGCKFYLRLLEIAETLGASPEVMQVLSSDSRPTGEQGKFIALDLAKRAVVMHFELG